MRFTFLLSLVVFLSFSLFRCSDACDQPKSSLDLQMDFPGVNEETENENSLVFDHSTNVLKNRFAGYEEMCFSSKRNTESLHIEFVDSLKLEAMDLVTIPGLFDILETVNFGEVGELFTLADSVLADSSMIGSGGERRSFLSLFNQDVMPNPQSPVIGESNVGDSTFINQVIRQPKIKSFLAAKKYELMWTKPDAVLGGNKKKAGLRLVVVKDHDPKEAIWRHIREAFVGGVEGQPAVRISLNAAGAMNLRKLTEENRTRSLAMVMDGVVWQLAKVREPLIEGRFELSGGLSKKQSLVLAAVLQGGALEVPFKIVK